MGSSHLLYVYDHNLLYSFPFFFLYLYPVRFLRGWLSCELEVLCEIDGAAGTDAGSVEKRISEDKRHIKSFFFITFLHPFYNGKLEFPEKSYRKKDPQQCL